MYTPFKKHMVDVVVAELQTLHSINQKVQPSSKSSTFLSVSTFETHRANSCGGKFLTVCYGNS